MNNTDYNIYEFPKCESIVISGDIHGDFNLLVNKMCVQYRMEYSYDSSWRLWIWISKQRLL